MPTDLRLRDPLTLPRQSLQQLAMTPDPAIWIEPGTERRKFLRRSPFVHLDPDGARQFNDLGYIEINYPPVFAASVRRATLTGFRTILKDDWFFNDEVTPDAQVRRYMERLADVEEHRNERTGLRRIDNSDRFLLEDSKEQPIQIEEPTILLTSDEPENYGSFLFRVLPKIVFYRTFARKCKILVSLPYRSMARLLEICGVDQDDVIVHDTRRRYHLEHVFVPSLRNPHAFLDDVSIGLFDEIRSKVAAGHPTNGRDLIFVSRQNLGSTKAGYRAMENETEVRDCLQQLGFRIVCPEAMSADEQVSAFSSAAIVVGQSGGAMFNVAFCRPGTIVVDIESEPHWIHAHMSYFSSLNLRYVIFEAKALPQADRAIHLPFRVNVGSLQTLMRSIVDNNLQHAA